jgi:two-component system response regulator DevR
MGNPLHAAPTPAEMPRLREPGLDASLAANQHQGMIRVFLLDDHEVVRRGVAASLEAEPDIDVVGDAGDAAEALEVIRACSPDVAVLDVRLGEHNGNGIDVCRAISADFPDVESLILTSFDNDRAIVEAGAAGAAGFVLKQIRSNELVDAIRQVAAGRRLLDDAEVRMAMRRLSESDEGQLALLTNQERRIFDLIGGGATNRQIAQDMFLAEKTVKNYVSNLLAKLGMARRTEAAALAARLEERSHHDG